MFIVQIVCSLKNNKRKPDGQISLKATPVIHKAQTLETDTMKFACLVFFADSIFTYLKLVISIACVLYDE